MIHLSNVMKPMTKDEVRDKCPYAFLKTPSNPGVSDKYVQANTETVIDDMMKLGWYPVTAKQCKQRKNSSGIRSFHMIAMESNDVKTNIMGKDGNVEAKVRIIIQNSHDGFNSFKFMVGVYRFICSNGCVVADAQFADFSIKHINYSFEELRVIVGKVMQGIPGTVSKLNIMNNIVLTDTQKREMAVETFKIRKGITEEDKVKLDDSIINELLTPVRTEDEGNTLWNVFNVLQEKMIKGSFFAPSKNGKNRKQRPITSIKKDIDYNQRLWAVASRYMPAAPNFCINY